MVFDEQTFPAKDKVTSRLPSKVNAIDDLPFIPHVSYFSLDVCHSSCTTPINYATAANPSTNSLPISSSPLDIFHNSCTTPFNSTIAANPNTNSLIIPSSHNYEPSLSLFDAHNTPDQSTIQNQPPLDSHYATQELIPSPSPPSEVHPMTTRSRTGSLKPKTFPDFHLYHTIKHPLKSYHTTLQELEPSCFSKAALDPWWQQAMAEEFQALISNGTWTLCPLPSNQHIINNKWVYQIKQKSDGSIERFKAKLVAEGYKQQCGIDHIETFSPVIKSSTIHVIFSLAVQFDWSIWQLDVSNAFLHEALAKEVFMHQPKGFVDKDHPHFVCKLNKALYGLKQAPRAWFKRLSSFLLELGYIASLVDSSLFILKSSAIHILMLVYVDDIIIIGSHSLVIQTIITKLQHEFPLKDLGPLHFFSWNSNILDCNWSASLSS